ncbi:helix-turn-helix domain-containing protein, partial [Falsiroseomonas sp. E2-1-a4]|uniref:helix-turn-helix domain-containing protein n=1 Tax=Falsiroseomonas sp. E2-1-a4 TaxID=3239299 RepID=UPI003F32374D
QVMQLRQLVLHLLAEPFEAGRTRSGLLDLNLAREAPLSAVFSPEPGCQVLDTPNQLLLRDYLSLLADELPRMTFADGERLAEVTKAMIALAVSEGPTRREAAAPLSTAQAARVRNLIRIHLSSARLGPTRLCQLAGITRSQLYRLFEPHGGVALFIQRERLNAAYRALTDPNDARSICRIAEASGLFDASSFSRMFRRTFGFSPRELRMSHSLRALAARANPPFNRGALGFLGSLQELLQATESAALT